MGTCSNILHGIASVSVDGSDVGYTEGGVEIEKGFEVFEKLVDQELDACDIVPTQYTMIARTQFAEATLENLKIAWNEPSSIVTTVGPPSFRTLNLGYQQTIPEHELIFIGYSPAGLQRKFTLWRAKSIDSSAMSLQKTEKVVIPVTFRCLPDVSKIEAERYGKVDDYT